MQRKVDEQLKMIVVAVSDVKKATRVGFGADSSFLTDAADLTRNDNEKKNS